MSKVESNFPSNNWVEGNSDERPKDKQICVVITSGRTIEVCQYRKNMHDMNELLYKLNIPVYFSWSIVDYWRPITLPEDVEKRFLKESYEENGI